MRTFSFWKQEGQSPLGLPPGGLFWFLALCPLGWGPRSRAWSAVGHIVGIPLTSVERSGSGRHTPPAFPWITRPRRHTPIRGETTWQLAPGVAHHGRPPVVCSASSAFTNGDPWHGDQPAPCDVRWSPPKFPMFRQVGGQRSPAPCTRNLVLGTLAVEHPWMSQDDPDPVKVFSAT